MLRRARQVGCVCLIVFASSEARQGAVANSRSSLDPCYLSFDKVFDEIDGSWIEIYEHSVVDIDDVVRVVGGCR